MISFKQSKILVIGAMSLLLCNGMAQTLVQKQNLEKYMNYRERYKRYFVKIGGAKGEGIPANWYETDGTMNWGDATSWLGLYYAVLASEYKLLEQDAKPTTATLNELYYAINALNRLDDYDRQYYDQSISLTNTYRDGFFMRDDVPATLINEWKNQYASVKDERYNLTKINSSFLGNFNGMNAWCDCVENEVSSDQLIDIFYGLRYVVSMIPSNVVVQPTPADAPMNIVQEAKNIVNRVMGQFQLFHNISNNKSWQNEPTIGAHASGDVRANWLLVNPVTGYKDGAGSEPRPLAYGIATTADKILGTPNTWTQLSVRHKEVDQPGDGFYGPNFDVSVGLHAVKTNIWDNLENFNPDPNNIGIDNPQHYCLGLSLVSYPNLDICYGTRENFITGSGGILQPNTALMSLYLAVAGNTWVHNNIANKANAYKMYPFDLADAVLNGASATNSYNFYENLLASAPCVGPYKYSDTDKSAGWTTSDIWEHPIYGGVERSGFYGDYVGMDYMLLYNLTHLYFKNSASLPSYDVNSNCDCANNPAIAKAYTLNSTNINGNVDVVRRFPQYKNIGIYLNEFITQPTTINTNGVVNNKTTLIVCGTTLDIKNGGILKNAVGQLASDSSRIMIRNGGVINVDVNGTVDIPSNTKLIIQKGSILKATNIGARIIVRTGAELIVEAGAFLDLNNKGTLIVEDNAKVIVKATYTNPTLNDNGVLTFNQGAEIQLNGNNALLELNGKLHIGDNATFTVKYPGSTSGYIKFNRGNTWWDNWATGNQHITCGVNSKFLITGQGKTDKMIEISQNVVAMPKNITNTTITNALVEFKTANAQFESDNTTVMTNNTFKGVLPSGYQYNHIGRGLVMFGQSFYYVGGCDFLNLGTGLTGALFYGNHSLTNVQQNLFKNCGTGIMTTGAGVRLNNNNFVDNEIAINNGGMEYNSSIANNNISAATIYNETLNFNEGTAGILSHGNNGEYSVINNRINRTNTALIFSNNNNKLRCNDLTDNDYVLYGAGNSKINMSSLLSAGYNKASGAKQFAHFEDANLFEANMGYNSFKILDQTHCYQVLGHGTSVTHTVCPIIGDGTIANFTSFNPATNDYNLLAELNFWRAPYFTGNTIEGEYFNVYKPYNMYLPVQQRGNLITGTALTNESSVVCPNVPPTNGGGSGSVEKTHPLSSNGSSYQITTAHFANQTLRNAVVSTLDLLGENSENIDTYSSSASLFTELLKYNYDASRLNSNDEYLLDLAYNKLFYCVAQLKEMYTDSLSNNEAIVTLNELFNDLHTINGLRVTRLNKDRNDYNDAVILIGLDNALVYGLEQNRAQALQLLNELMANNPRDSYKKAMQHWYCIYDTEQQAIDGVISTDDAIASMQQCSFKYLSNTSNATAKIHANNNQTNTENRDVTVFPNPAQNDLTISYHLSNYKSLNFELYDVRGKLVLSQTLNPEDNQFKINHLDLDNGVYLYSIKADNEILMTKKLIFMK